MKSNNYFAVLFILFATFACQDIQFEKVNNVSNYQLQTIANTNYGVFTAGAAHVVTTQENEIVVIMNDKLFVGFRPDTSNVVVEFSSDNVSVINFSTSFLIYNHETQKGYFLSLDIDDRLTKLPENIVSKLITVPSYGLSQRNGDYENFFENPSIIEDTSIKELDQGIAEAFARMGGGASCDSGGEGASSCSISDDTMGGCSVSCSSGYACCSWNGIFEETCICIQG